MNYIGIDPGKKGCIVFLDDYGTPSMFRLEHATEAEIVRFLKSAGSNSVCVIERVGATPQMGRTSAFTFGFGYGIIVGCLAGADVPYKRKTPNEWQTTLNCRTGGDKNISKAEAQRLFPSLTITHHEADALLIATFCKLKARELFPQVAA